MASWIDAKGLLVNAPPPLTDLMKCTICIDKLDRPRVLPCLHSFCEKCLQLHMENYAKDSEGRLQFISTRTFPCPTCREVTAIPNAGVKGFKHDFRIEQLDDLLKEFSINKPIPDLHHRDADKKDLCEFCPNEPRNHVFSYCVKCRRKFCRRCASKHKSLPLFREHTVQELDLDQCGSNVVSEGTCPMHQTENTEFYCITCEESVCVKCTMTKHVKHSLTDINSGISRYYETAKSLCVLLEKRLQQLQLIMTQLNTNEKLTKQIQKDAKKKIHQRADEVIHSVREEERKLIRDLSDKARHQTDNIGSVRNEVELSLVSMQSMFDYAREMVQKDKFNYTLAPVYQELISGMEQLLERSLFQGMSDLDMTIKFTASKSKVKIGKIKWEESPKGVLNLSMLDIAIAWSTPGVNSQRRLRLERYKTLIVKGVGKEGKRLGEFHMPKDVCFLRDGSILIADTGNDRLQILDANGLPLKTICEGKVRAWGVATDGQDIFVADAMGKCVTVIDQTGLVKRRFGKFLCPCGVAISHKSDILVTDFFSPSLYCYSQGGGFLSQFDFRDKQDRHASGVSYLAVTQQGNIVISDISNHSIKIYNKHGKRINKISETSGRGPSVPSRSTLNSVYTGALFSPQGVSVDENDTVLQVDGSKHRVNIHSATGTYLTTFLEDNCDWRGLSGIAVFPKSQTVAMTDVIAHQVVLLQRTCGSGLHSIVDKLPRDVVTTSAH